MNIIFNNIYILKYKTLLLLYYIIIITTKQLINFVIFYIIIQYNIIYSVTVIKNHDESWTKERSR